MSDTPRGASQANVGDLERVASMTAGSVLLLALLFRRERLGLLGFGALLLYRGFKGRCPLYASLGASTAAAPRPDLEKRFGEGTRDRVEEASWESFPASDPPSY